MEVYYSMLSIQNMNDDLLVQVIMIQTWGKMLAVAAGPSSSHVSMGIPTPSKLKFPVNVKFFTNVADNFIPQKIQGKQALLL